MSKKEMEEEINSDLEEMEEEISSDLEKMEDLRSCYSSVEIELSTASEIIEELEGVIMPDSERIYLTNLTDFMINLSIKLEHFTAVRVTVE